MTVYGSTQVYLFNITGSVEKAEVEARILEDRGFELLSVSYNGAGGHILTMRASRCLFVNFTVMPLTAPTQHYQMGPYNGQSEAEKGVRSLDNRFSGAVNIHITAQREHTRVFMPQGDAADD